MYVPAAFAVHDEAILFDFIERFGFATLVSQTENGPFATHVPLLLDRDGRRLLGHVARANPHWKILEGGDALAIFHGPHAYISPTWYVTSPAVPTWNYAAVHIYGKAKLVGAAQLGEIVERLVSQYELAESAPQSNSLPADLRAKLLADIVGFELPIEGIQGKFKLGQNRAPADQASMLARLEAGNDEERGLARFIRQQQPASERT
jgi:transcriptional regulator